VVSHELQPRLRSGDAVGLQLREQGVAVVPALA